jgi:hypothetical protein
MSDNKSKKSKVTLLTSGVRQKYFSTMKGGSSRIVDRYMHENSRRAYFQNMTEDEFRKHRQTTIDMEQAGYFKN